MHAGMERLKVTQDKHDFPSNKCCFHCGSSTHFTNKCNIAKGKTCRKCGKEGHFASVCKSKPQKILVNLLQNESSPDEEYCFTINSSLAKTTFALSNALPVEFLIESGSSINIINQDLFDESLMPLTFERSFVKIYLYGCETPLPVLGKGVVEIYFNCNNKRTFATFHVIDAVTSCILGKSRSELPCVLTVLQPSRYEQISALTNSDLKYRLNSLLHEYIDIFESTGALKNFELNIQIHNFVQPCVEKPRRLPFLMKKQVENEIQKLLEQDFIEPVPF